MTTPDALDHAFYAEALRASVLDGPGDTPPRLRCEAAARAAGGTSMEAPFDALARQVGEDAHRVTDAQVAAVAAVAGARGTFETIVAAALGAGLHRWQRGLAVLEEAGHKEAGHAPP